MNSKSLEAKLEYYYDKLQNPSKIIGNWAIIDIQEFKRLNKIKLTSISSITKTLEDNLISAESKDYFIIIKYNLNFIATKVISTEYDYLLEDWNLIAIDRNHLYGSKANKLTSTKEIIKLLNLKLTKKAKLDLDYFD